MTIGRRALAAQRLPDDIRAKGWLVASHRDEVDGTVWTFRNPRIVRMVTGRGKTDRDALNIVRERIKEIEAGK